MRLPNKTSPAPAALSLAAAMATARTSLMVLLLAAVAQAKLPLPPYVRPCSFKLSDRKLSECALERAREIFPKVTSMKGDPKYNIPVLEPMFIDQLLVIDGKGPLGLQLIATDVNLYGLRGTVINSVTHSTKDKTNTYVATIPDMHIEAKYNVSGRILLLPIVGQGNVVMNLKNVKLVYQFNFNIEKLEDGETYYLPQPGARLDIDAGGMNVTLDNLFNGDKALLDTTNRFLNEEWRDVFDSLKPSFSDAIAKMITNIFNGVFRQVTFKDSFTDVDIV